jgi:hypothetical protein
MQAARRFDVMSAVIAVLIVVPCLVAGVGLGVLVCVKLSELGERRHDRIEHTENGSAITISWAGVSASHEPAD